MKRPLQVTYYFVYGIRRSLFISFSYFLTDYPILQIICLNLMNLLILIYITEVQPFFGRFRNRIELMNDFGQILLSFHIMYFTDWVSSPDTQVMYGWVMITFTGVMIVINMSIIFSNSSH